MDPAAWILGALLLSVFGGLWKIFAINKCKATKLSSKLIWLAEWVMLRASEGCGATHRGQPGTLLWSAGAVASIAACTVRC